MVNMKDILQVVSVTSLVIGSILNLKKNRWCFVWYQIGAIARSINYINVDLNIELLVQAFFTYINVKSFVVWKKKK